MPKLREHIAVALDQFTRAEALDFINKTKNECGFYKIGLELFLRYGQDFIRELNELEINLFLDLKLHDIPNTVYQSIKSLSGLKINFLTIHLLGGAEMLKKAREARDLYLPHTKLLGVSFLTSHDEAEFQNILGIKSSNELENAFKRLFTLAEENKIDGVVHAGSELNLANKYSFFSICPGIRFEDEISSGIIQDQKRVVTPKMAFDKGARILVIGRSLTNVKSDLEFSERIKNLNDALS